MIVWHLVAMLLARGKRGRAEVEKISDVKVVDLYEWNAFLIIS